MFTWDKSIRKIDATVDQVVQLFSSMRDVQMALPGLPVQQASAYLCQCRSGNGIATLAAFHMKKSEQLAFYVSQPPLVSVAKAEEMFDSGLVFVESMGFLLTDMDLHLLDGADRDMFWASLPIVRGLVKAEDEVAAAPAQIPPPKVTPAAVTPDQFTDVAKASSAIPAQTPAEPAPVEAVRSSSAPEHRETVSQPLPEQGLDDSVNDLLAAVEALRTKRPGARARRNIKPADLQKRRIDMRQNIGRLLASL
ncbi:MAG: hypothetical protein RQ723_09470 [Desulfuromonadales bacterium]|nr:hypothetical protein [Desulfuromonadales bacterium]